MTQLKISTICGSLLVALLLLACGQKQDTLFKQLPVSQTGIDFSNRINDSDTFSILTYEYIYNGGGVATADFNNDGLLDAFFSGNMVDNRLYLNQGDFQFTDITKTAAVDGNGRWNSGIAVVDINTDGWLDLYVCATTHEPGAKRANLLYINQGVNAEGIPTFEEQAAAYGLADTSHTTNAAFFDYDKDGDLDVYLLVNEMDEERLPNRYRPKITDGSTKRTDKLFRNEGPGENGHPVFTDVSAEAGILIEGFGLGLNITDINQDSWPDVYVTNDYLTNDLLYINNGDGTFTDRAADYFKHTAHSAMGNDVVDLNNDGLTDVVAVDMLPEDNFRRKTMLMPNNYNTYLNNDRFGYQYQYVRNVLQLNQGKRPEMDDPIFSEIAMLSGIAATDWSWAPLITDFDNDGYRDIIITNGFPRDITDRDFIDYFANNRAYASQEMLLYRIPQVKLNNYVFRNTGELTFEEVTESWGMNIPSFSNGAAYADLDNDGDMDVLVNNINDSAFVFQNTLLDKPEVSGRNWLKINLQGSEKNPQGLGAKVEVFYNEKRQFWEQTPYRGYLSSIDMRPHFGLGESQQVDKLVVTWPDGKQQVLESVSANQVLTLKASEASEPNAKTDTQNDAFFKDVTAALGVNFVHDEQDYIDFNVQPLLPHKLSQFGPGLAVADVNGDGLDDFYVSGSLNRKGTFFVQQADGSFTEKDLLPEQGEERYEELGSLFFDADGDGDSDLYLVSGGYELEKGSAGYQDRLFLNEGGQFVLAENALPEFINSGGCVKAADFDRDGDLDIFVGGRVEPQTYPKPVSSYLLRNDTENGEVQFTLAEDAAPGLEEIGLVCEAIWTDFDNDDWMDLVVVGEWMPVQFFKNDNGTLSRQATALEELKGFWNSVVGADFDKDGDTDYIAGNLGLNTLNKPSKEQTISIFAKDFDGNEGYDAVPTAYFPDRQGVEREYPYFNRLDVEKQIVFVKDKFPYHKDFGVATIDDVLSPEQQEGALVLRANYSKTSYIENKGDGTFEVHPLPIEAQLAPIFGMLAEDYNQDGHLDVLLTGNDFSTEIAKGRYDALNGLLLLGDGMGNFKAVDLARAGFFVPGDGKSLVQLQGAAGQSLVVASQNRDSLKIFEAQDGATRTISLQAQDAYAVVHLPGGVYRQEFYYGHSFLSQSARRFAVPMAAEKVEVVDFQGNKREVALGEVQ